MSIKIQCNQMIAVKLSWATSCIRWLKSEQTKVLRTVCVLIIRDDRIEAVLELKHWFVFQFNHLIWLVGFVLWFSGLYGWVPIIVGYKVEDRCSMFLRNTALHVTEAWLYYS